MSEFNEPWSVAGADFFSAHIDVGKGGIRIRVDQREGSAFPSAVSFAARIVACVNACAGISTADLERARQFMPTLAAPLSDEQKAELLNALESSPQSAVVAIPRGMECKPKPFTAGTTASEAIQKLRDAGLDAWDKIEDPEAFIRELRGEEPAPLVWRKEPPDRPGWWFWKKKNDREPVVLEIMQRASGQLLVSWWDSDRELTEPMFADSLWAGPIQQPEAPK